MILAMCFGGRVRWIFQTSFLQLFLRYLKTLYLFLNCHREVFFLLETDRHTDIHKDIFKKKYTFKINIDFSWTKDNFYKRCSCQNG